MRRPLTPRQVQVLRHKAAGLGYREIAAALGCSPDTVRSHLQAAYDRLGVGSAEEAYAALGWLVVPS